MLTLTFVTTSSLWTVPVLADSTQYGVQVAATELTPAAGKIMGNANPLITHKFGADPFAMEYNGRIYVYMTNDHYTYDSNGALEKNQYGKINKITVISSDDMVNWTDHGEIVVGGRNDSAGVAKWATNSWAPAAAHKTIDGKEKFFLYFADNGGGIGVLTADSPIGPFTDPLGKALISRSTPNCSGDKVPWLFDPAVLVDGEDAYLYFGGGIDFPTGQEPYNPNSARVVKLGADMISIEGEPVAIDAPRLFEDSGIHKFNGKYYYSYCSNFSGTAREGYPPTGTIAYMVSDGPLGPFEYVGPILPGPHVFGNGDGGNNHHAIFEFGGKWYIIYHTRQVDIARRQLQGLTGNMDYRSPSISYLNINSSGVIQERQMENQGVSQLKNMNPYERVEAETIGWNGGISTEKSAQPGGMVSSINLQVNDIHNGDWIALSDVDFGIKGAGTFTANVASSSNGSEIELRLDNLEGPVIGILPVSSTGGLDSWATKTTVVSGATGVHDLYMIFKGQTTEELFKFDYWKFEEKSDTKELVAINASIDKEKIDTLSGSNIANIKVMAMYADGTSEDVTGQAVITSDEEGIVEINNGTVTGIGFGTAKINVSYNGKTDVLNILVKSIASEETVKSLTVDKNFVTLDSGSTETFKVTAEYLDGHTQDVTTKATYDNPNPEVAEVANGKITAKGRGTTEVTVSFKGAVGEAATAQISVTVNVPAVIAIEAEKAADNTVDAYVYGPSVNGYTWALVDGVFEKAMQLTPANNTAVTVNTDPGSLAAGTRLGYKLDFKTAGKYNVWIFVKTSNYQSDSIHVGLDNQYKFTANGIEGKCQSQFKWVNLSDGSDGVILGAATLDISAGVHELNFWGRESGIIIDRILLTTSSSKTAPVWPTDPTDPGDEVIPVTGITLDKSTLDLRKGSTGTLTATVTPAHATNKTITFESDNEAVATVTGAVYDEVTGTTTVTVHAIAAGNATITATTVDGSKTAACDVTVTAPSNSKPFVIITDEKLIRDGGLRASVQIGLVQGAETHNGKEAVVFQLMKENTPISMSALVRDITSQEKMTGYFNVDPADTSYTVRIYVLDRFDTDMTAPISLAESVILK